VNQQSKILFWLLLVATALVNAVVASWLREVGPQSRTAFLYDGLVSGQLAVVTLWAVLGARPTSAAWVAPLVAIVVAAPATAKLCELSVAETIGFYGSFMAALAIALWILKRTRLWRRLSGQQEDAVWQFSLAYLLIAMTTVAVLIGALRRSELLLSDGLWKYLTLLTIGDVALAVGTLIAWKWSSWMPFWWLRLGGACFVAFFVGGLETAAALSGTLGESIALGMRQTKSDLIATSLVTSLVIFVYLELAPIVDQARPAENDPPDDPVDNI
jgi:hypothetical protein